ncbi:hypothetical protein EDD11_001026 [Mortierella claussenii]|nr:hypothetical protein EDD11_001026 [Mortierella claussenii]
MTIQGLHAEPVALNSVDFEAYQKLFNGKLRKLYRVTYNEIVPRNLENGDWSTQFFYHGTSHCGCLDRRVIQNEPLAIPSQQWCANSSCATQGIISSGHLLTYNAHGAHFFSPNVTTALSYSMAKSGPHQFLSVFVCKTRNCVGGIADICRVHRDADIHPYFLAIVSR